MVLDSHLDARWNTMEVTAQHWQLPLTIPLSLKLWGMSAHVPTKSLYSATICRSSRSSQSFRSIFRMAQQPGGFHSVTATNSASQPFPQSWRHSTCACRILQVIQATHHRYHHLGQNESLTSLYEVYTWENHTWLIITKVAQLMKRYENKFNDFSNVIFPYTTWTRSEFPAFPFRHRPWSSWSSLTTWNHRLAHACTIQKMLFVSIFFHAFFMCSRVFFHVCPCFSSENVPKDLRIHVVPSRSLSFPAVIGANFPLPDEWM